MDWILLLFLFLSDTLAGKSPSLSFSLFKKQILPFRSPELPGPKPFLPRPKSRAPPEDQHWLSWPGAAVIYSMNPNVGCPDSKLCEIIMRAMKHYEKRTCIRFKARSGEEDYVTISWDGSVDSNANLGRIGGQQLVTFGPKSLELPFIALHEFGHVVGLPEEISRSDRDKYIRIEFDNIKEELHKYFEITEPPIPVVLQEPFDYKSVMMYNAVSGSKDGVTQTIFTVTDQPLVPREAVKELSDGDTRKIGRIYKCQGTNQDPSFPFDVACSLADEACGFKNLNDAKWLRESSDLFSRRVKGKFMYVNFATNEYGTARLASVNFHGLSPLDKTRGPKGCVTFSYFISTDGPAMLTLSQRQLESPHQEPEGIEPTILWSQSKLVTRWDVKNIPVNVERPFMLIFEAQFEPGTKDGIIGLGDFVLKYTPCEKTPSSSTLSSETRDSLKLSKSLSRALDRATFRKKSKFRQFIGCGFGQMIRKIYDKEFQRRYFI